MPITQEAQASIKAYKEQGFTEETIFPGEYTLLVKPATMDAVRVYDHGVTWVKNPVTGEYDLPGHPPTVPGRHF